MSPRTLTQRSGLYAAICMLLCFWPTFGVLADRQSVRQGYASPEEAAAALASAARAHDQAALSEMFGAGSDKLLSSGDRFADEERQRRLAAAYDERHALVPEGPERMELHIGNDDWQLPILIVQRAEARGTRSDHPTGGSWPGHRRNRTATGNLAQDRRSLAAPMAGCGGIRRGCGASERRPPLRCAGDVHARGDLPDHGAGL
jgi:hypothetical protein